MRRYSCSVAGKRGISDLIITMARKRKKKTISPRHKCMNRARRLQSARHWIPKYLGKNLLRGYKNHFGVDWLCAIIELQMLGVNLDPSYVANLKQSLENQTKSRKRKKEDRTVDASNSYSNETFAYIAGYTPAGVPYGITWEEMNSSIT